MKNYILAQEQKKTCTALMINLYIHFNYDLIFKQNNKTDKIVGAKSLHTYFKRFFICKGNYHPESKIAVS